MAAVALAGADWLGWVVYISGVASLHYACHHGTPPVHKALFSGAPALAAVLCSLVGILLLQYSLLSSPILLVCGRRIPLSGSPEDRQWHGPG